MSRRKPTAQKELEGTNRASRANPNEPKYRAAAPAMPDWLCDAAKAEWKRVVPKLETARVLAETDLAVLAAYCEVFAEIRDLTERMRRGEVFLTDASESSRADKYPLADERRKAIMRLEQLAGRLGLSPSDRAGVNSIPEGEKRDDMDMPDRPPARKGAGRPAERVN